MNAQERVCTALRRQQPDRVPILTYLNGDSPNISGSLRQFILTNTDVFYTASLFTGFHCTGLELPRTETKLEGGWTEATYDAGDCGRFSEIYKHGETGRYTGYRKRLISDPVDIERLMALPSVPPSDSPGFPDWIARVNADAKRHRADGAFVRVVLYGPLYYLANYASPEELAIWTIEHRQTLLSYMEVVLRRELDYLEYALERLEFEPVFNIAGAEWAIPPLMPPQAFDYFVFRFDEQLIDLIHKHSKLVYYHCHGKVRSFIPRFVEMGADGLHPLEPVGNTGDCDLPEVKQRFGNDICLVGNVQYDDFARLAPEEMEQTVRAACEAAREGGGFIFAPSCTPYHRPLPARVEENIVKFIDAGLKYGAY